MTSDGGNALHKLEGGLQQAHLGVNSHVQQIAVAEGPHKSAGWLALGVVDAALRDLPAVKCRTGATASVRVLGANPIWDILNGARGR